MDDKKRVGDDLDNALLDDVEYSSTERKGSGFKSTILFAAAAILIFIFVNNQIMAGSSNPAGLGGFTSQGGCCSSNHSSSYNGEGSCCGGGSSYSEQELSLAGLDYYRANYGEDDVEAVVKDFGCHQEIFIYRGSEVVARFSYLNGTINDLTR